MTDENQESRPKAETNPPITLVFTLSDINAVLDMLRKYLMEQVEPIVNAIRQQALPQLIAINKQGEAQ